MKTFALVSRSVLKTVSAFFFFNVALTVGIHAQDARIGEFTSSSDVGSPNNAGKVVYEPVEQTYTISGSGTNMWAAVDEFQFAWRKMTGNMLLTARAKWLTTGVDPHRKLGWIIRKSLDKDSAYVDVAIHGDGLTSLQYRRTSGAITEQVRSTVTGPDVFQLARHNGKFTMSVAKFGDPLVANELDGVDLGDEVYVGLFVCSHNAETIETAQFDNVRVVIPAADNFRPYRDYIGSHLETLSLESGRRQVLHSVHDSLQAPNWTVDGQTLIYNRNGRLFNFDLAGRKSVQLDTGTATQNNNDHVLSFDGKMLGISHHTGPQRKSVIYTVPVSGGTPKQVTRSDEHSYFHGWSPDGRHLVYTAQRNGDFDIYRIPAEGGEEVNLTKTPGLDDGSEYAPDGQSIYFNSSRSGRMQIWKMNSDGTGQTQVTDDDFNNWFPHVAPDGKSIAILSFPSNIDKDDHPFYKPVYLRQVPIAGGQPKTIAYLYGGQGTINVPSWSPDGKQLAFVSNSAGIPHHE